GTHRAKPDAGGRFGLWICGSKGMVVTTTGSLPAAFFLADPAWGMKGNPAWQRITSAGGRQPETLEGGGPGAGHGGGVKGLVEAIEQDRQPKGSIYDGRAALEMIMAVYESHRLKSPVELPLKNRKQPLTML